MTDDLSGGNSAAAVSEGPATFEQAFASDASPASATPDQTNDAAAAEQPTADQASPQQTDDRSPLIPRARFDEVNTRMQAAEQWKQDRAWAESIDQQTFSQMAHWYQAFAANPVTFLQNVAAEMQQHPEYGPQLKSMAARTLASYRGQSAGPDLSQVVIDLGNGQQIPLSDLRAQWVAEVEQKLAPKLQTVESLQQEREHLQAKQKADTFASNAIAEVSKQPGFAEHKAEIAKVLAGMRLPSDDPAAVEAAFLKAYMQVVLPTLGQKAESRLLDSLQKKAAASTSVNPGSVATATPKGVSSFDDPSLVWK